jgi:hypothetical protein
MAAPRTPEALAELIAHAEGLTDPKEIAEAREAIDHVAAQRDAYASHLFWFTDLEAAKTEARKTGRPILSLRLLGHLDDERSCANSRFFRLILYSNTTVSRFLRDTYVLHWSSERPVPTLTVDYGDGRVVKSTITGNSVHYVLDAEGRLVDALPGLYGPTAFEKGLRASLELARTSGTLSDEESAKAVAKYHTRAVWKANAEWVKLLHHAYGEMYDSWLEHAHLPTGITLGGEAAPLHASLPAAVVNALTMSKADTEAPPLALMQPQIWVSSPWEGWSKVAATQPIDHLDVSSRALIESKHPRDWSSTTPGELDASKLALRFTRFETRLREEQLRNEYEFHGAIHQHLSKASRVAFASTNDFVYRRLFMTPQGDPWLGLMPLEAITGLPDDGIVALGK